MVQCKICKSEDCQFVEETKILNKYDAKLFCCPNCGFAFFDNPIWLQEAYESSITKQDTSIMKRSEDTKQFLSILIYYAFDKNKKFLDYAGGYGFLTRAMRDAGFDFFWDDKYSENLAAKGFEGDLNTKYEIVTCFEGFEHFENPIFEIEKMLNLSDTIVFSVDTYKDIIPKIKDWTYYGTEHGQHISFYGTNTLNKIAELYSLNYYNFFGLHILTKKNIKEKLQKIQKIDEKTRRLCRILNKFLNINLSSKELLFNKITAQMQSLTIKDYDKLRLQK